MDFLQHRFLCYEKKTNSFLLLGYPLLLSPTESYILKQILQHGAQDAQTLSVGNRGTLTRGAVAVHICSINRKASQISDRKLVEFRNNAYRLSSRM